MIEVKSCGLTVAYINHQPRLADGFVKETPWLLLHTRGRIDRFATMSEARAEARKSWHSAAFSRVAA